MKIKLLLSALFIKLLLFNNLNAQVPVPFSPRLQNDFVQIKGDLVMIGNNIVSAPPSPNLPYNGNEYNDFINMTYIDVDDDSSTFSSSAALLNLNTSCYRIVYAGLYWAAVYPYEQSNNQLYSQWTFIEPRQNDWQQMKFKVPGGEYVTITAEENPPAGSNNGQIIFDGLNANNIEQSFFYAPYVCYKDITDMLLALDNPNGWYYGANIRASQGIRGGGSSGGWVMLVIYEDLNLPGRYISTFDGYAGVTGTSFADIQVDGFQTLPTPLPVRAKVGVVGLEGDNRILGDSYLIKANSNANFTVLSDAVNPATNFFNSVISNGGVINTDRIPASPNTLGWDVVNLTLNNPLNSVLPNGETGATLRLQTTGDWYGSFLTTFVVDIIEPDIPLIKTVENTAGENINNQPVLPGQEIFYTLSFQNNGNDDAINFVIEDLLPDNTKFPPNGTLQPGDLILPPGVTYVYDPVLHKLTFNVNSDLVVQNAPSFDIRIKVKLIEDCFEFRQVCSNLIQNQAFSTYQGVLNPNIFTNRPSFASFDLCNNGVAGSTNFLVDLEDCDFQRIEVLCAESILLTAPDGYLSYEWTDQNGTVISNNQNVTVTQAGVYNVNMQIPSPCYSVNETVTVQLFSEAVDENPIIPFANEVFVCPNDGRDLPIILLCGEEDSRQVQTGIVNAQQIIWEKLVDGSCPTVALPTCANTNPDCLWQEVALGNNYTITEAGEYKITLIFQDGCFQTFYFNVFKNTLDPTVISQNIICETPGSITVNNLPAGYEISLSANGPFQTSNVFNISQAGVYTIFIRQIGVTNGCLFTIPNVNILDQNFAVNLVKNDDVCNNGLGSITVQTNNGEPQYYYQLFLGNNLIANVGPIADSFFTFSNLNSGNYTVIVTTDDGCTSTQPIEIINNETLQVTAVIDRHLGCDTGIVTLYGVGGEQPYNYAIYSFNGVLVDPADYVFLSAIIPEPGNNDGDNPGDEPGNPGNEPVNPGQSSFILTEPGIYQFIIVDFNNCTAVSNPVELLEIPPLVFDIATTDVNCHGEENGSIVVNLVSSSQGYQINYGLALNNLQPSNTFSNLAPGNYTIYVAYGSSNTLCEETFEVTINQPDPLTADAEIIQQINCIENGSIQIINVSGGVPPYQYSLNGTSFVSNPVFNNLPAGTYSITVRDSNQCVVVTNSVNLIEPPQLTALNLSNTVITCLNTTAALEATIIGGTAPFTFQILSPSVINPDSVNDNTANFSNLSSGFYTVQVTDALGCSITNSVFISPVNPIQALANLVSNVSCLGGADGEISLYVSNFSQTFSYSINGGSIVSNQSNGNILLSNLTAGTYNFLVIDDLTGCQAITSVEVSEPNDLLSVNITSTPITCLSPASLTVNASGGWGVYSYLLTLPDNTQIGPQNNNFFANLTQAGTYTILVTDANGCTVSETLNFELPILPELSLGASSNLCFTSSGATVNLAVSGGTAPFAFSVNGSTSQGNNEFNNLSPGTYNFLVTDALGCSANLTVTINPALFANATVSKALDCSSSPDAVISVNMTNGLAPYTYQVSFNGGALSATVSSITNSFQYTAVAGGNYNFVITDSAGCVTQTNINVIPIQSININNLIVSQPILCHGDATGAISFTTTSGTPPFTVQVLNTTTNQNFGSQLQGLTAGNYQITVTDANLCSEVLNITIQQPDPISFEVTKSDITCNNPGGTSFGEINVINVSGGVEPYTYVLSNNFGFSEVYNATANENHTFIILNFGIYKVEVIDANGCVTLEDNIIIASPPDDLIIDVSAITADCIAGGEATVTVTSAVSSGFYEFGILEFNELPYTSNWQPANPGTPETTTFTGLTPGVIYTFVVHDLVTNCYYFKSASAPIPSPSNMNLVIDTIANVSCTGFLDGNVSLTISNYDATATQIAFEIFQFQSNLPTGISGTNNITGPSLSLNNLGPLAPGIYYVLLTEIGGVNDGCSIASQSFTITQSFVPLNVSAQLVKNDNCNDDAGIVSAVAQNGTAPYQYMILPSSAIAPTVSTWSGSSLNVFNVSAGDFVVYALDSNGCIASTPISVGLDPSPEITANLVDPCVEQGSFEIQISLTQTGTAPYTYTVNGTNVLTDNATSLLVQNLSSGNYNIVVTDSNGCSDSTDVTIFQNLTAFVSALAQPTCSDDDGTIEVTANNGSGQYSFQLLDEAFNPIANNSTGNFNGLGFGIYNIIVTDVVTNCVVNLNTSLIAPTPVMFTVVSQNISCFGGNDGVIQVILGASNNNPPYTYSLSNGVDTITQSQPVFTNLIAGDYTVTVTSALNCSETFSLTLTQPNPLALTVTADEFVCTSNNTASTVIITASASGGVNPYLYSLNGADYFPSNTFSVADNGSVQTFTVFAIDTNGCLISESITINPLPVFNNSLVTLIDVLTCTNPEVVEVSIAGGSGEYTFQLLPNGPLVGPTTNTSALFNLPEPGTYFFQITDVGTGCFTVTEPHIVQPIPTANVIASAVSPVSCFAGNDGSLSYIINGYTGSFSYSLTNLSGQTILTGTLNTANAPFVLNNLAADTYIVTIEFLDTPFCVITSNAVTISSPNFELSLTLSQTADVTCENNAGTINAIASGGTAPYVYQLVNQDNSQIIAAYSSLNVFASLSAGNYLVFVRDANNCETSQPIMLLLPTPIDAQVEVVNTNLLCFGDTNAAVTINATGGQGVFQYTLVYENGAQSGPQVFNQFNNLGAGTYFVIVTDGWFCSYTTPTFTINEPSVLSGTLVINSNISCETDAVIQILANGGTAPYLYSLDGVNFSAQNTYSVGPGSYQFYVTDANNCTAILTNTVSINPVAPLSIDLNLSNLQITCNGDNNASVIATANGGLGSYTYTLLDANQTILQGPQLSQTFSNLVAGVYFIRVNSFDCEEISASFEVTQPEELLVSSLELTDITCFNESNGSITINVAGGTPPYLFSRSPNLALVSPINTFTNLSAGNYDIFIQDANGCFMIENITLSQPDELFGFITNIQPEVCEGNDDGTVTIDIVGGTAPYFTSFDVDEPNSYIEGQFTFENISAGQDYFIYIMDANGCKTNVFVPMGTPPVDLNPTLALEACADGNILNSVIVTVEPNNLSEVEYALDDQANYQASNVFTNLTPGLHLIYVRHSNGCIKVLEVDVPEPLTVNHQTQDVTCFNESNGSITVEALGGVAPYSYAISPNFNFVATNTFTQLVVGDYTVRVRDVNNCEVEFTTNIQQPDLIEMVVTDSLDEICLGDANGFFEITITGGVAPYETSLNNNQNYVLDQTSFFDLSGGVTYTVFIRDASGCELSYPVTLNPPVNLNPQVQLSYNCDNNNVTGTAVITVQPQYQGLVLYSIDGINFQQSNEFTMLSSGNYTAYVLHDNGCLNNDVSFTIISYTPLTLTVAESGLNQLSATAIGGTGVYTYFFNGANQGTNNVFGISQSGVFVITVVDSLGCEQTVELNATFFDIEIPNFFTPDGNTYNDFWSPQNIQGYPNITSKIFDRYGRLVKILRIGESWDGKYQNKDLPSGDYWYLIELNDGSERSFIGNVTLYR